MTEKQQRGMPLRLFILDKEGQILFSSPVGEEMLTAVPSLKAICAQLAKGAGQESGEMVVRFPGSDRWCALRVLALDGLHPAVGVVVDQVDVYCAPVNSHPRKNNGTPKISGTFKLSRRETEVIEAVEVGLTDKQIAGRLSVSPETVRGYLKTVRAKLGVSTRTAILHKIHTDTEVE
ncbi:MAG: helix-turn-helix transcriptional regulator [Gammaproteobacteria bacterium]